MDKTLPAIVGTYADTWDDFTDAKRGTVLVTSDDDEVTCGISCEGAVQRIVPGAVVLGI